MSLFRKIFPALALAITLSPLAAQAHGADAAQKTGHFAQIMSGSATIDNPTTIYGGVSENSLRNSFGG